MAKPKLGELIDMAYEARAKRIAFQREADAKIEDMKRFEDEVEERILTSFDKAEIEGARGSKASASVSRLMVPTVKNWPKVYAYIKANDAWDLLERRMARVAYRDRLEAGEAIPGTEPFEKVSLSLTRINQE